MNDSKRVWLLTACLFIGTMAMITYEFAITTTQLFPAGIMAVYAFVIACHSLYF